MRNLKVGTRKSPLAMKQTELVVDMLKAKHPELGIEIVGISTLGDRDQKSKLSEIGGKGIFAKEVERELIDSEIDFAVHSLKDLPAILPEGLVLAAHPKRANPLDCVVYPEYSEKRISDGGLRLGTGSSRRIKQLGLHFSDVETVPIRGKIETRLEKMLDEHLDGVVLACAGLERMGYLDHLLYEPLCPDNFVPAVGQGILGVECRMDDEEVFQLLKEISDPETEQMAIAERKFLELMNGNCDIPLGALAQRFDEEWVFNAFLAKDDNDAGRSVRFTGVNPLSLAVQAYEELMK
ncbi:hydroxymethylbilane synthase [Lactococcus allomyrinae]|uniref:Hydroxymethylbilane synthase n=1 Tax=Lactococcus allomyrinae TaxID=2419773 RepID=A0A387BCG4_9LACT|nr:hydroxymethylbilane synthase [Lactococcus allomyrinae]AYG00148.1 hydroxymethylbilane synthase [Lactococcus allomyrinae]